MIILALLQFRVIQDSYLMLLCYGIVFVSSILCIMSMPALSNVIPMDTKEVSRPPNRSDRMIIINHLRLSRT